jgi:hypothetical protein
VRTERRSAAPLVDLARFRDPALASGCAMSLLVTAVVMATLVVGPFYLSGALGLGAGRMGLAMAAGPVVAAIAGVPAGRAVDRVGAHAAMLAGLAGMELGAWLLWASPPSTVGGYAAWLAVLTAGYALFQAANNTAVMAYAAPAQRGLVSGLLNLSRNLGLITGAAAMAALFMYGAGERGLAAGFRSCFGVAALLVGIAIVIAAGLALAGRSSYTRSGCHPIGVLARTASIALSVTHTQEEVMADDKDKAQSGNQKGQGSGQGSGHGSGHYGGGPGAGTSRESGFVPSSPEANVFPAGAAQTSHGSADGNPIPRGTQGAAGGQTDMTAAASGGNPDGAAPSAAGTPDEGRLGGSNGTSASGTTGNDPDR